MKCARTESMGEKWRSNETDKKGGEELNNEWRRREIRAVQQDKNLA